MGSGKIVICDDNPRVLDALKNQINREYPDCSIVGTAQNGKDGLEIIKKSRPHILITDINMPGLSGLDMIQAYRKEGIFCTEILITGYDEFEYAYRATKLKVFDLLMKPVDPDDFLDTFSRALNSCLDRDNGDRDDNPYREWRQLFFTSQDLENEIINTILNDMDRVFHNQQEKFKEGYQILQFWIAEWMTSHVENYSVNMMRTPIEIRNRAESIKTLKEANTDLQLYIRNLMPAEIGEENVSPLVSNALRMIHQTDPRDLTLSMLAEELDISAAYLGDQIKRSTGKTFSEIAHRYRLGIASTLLTTTNMPIKDISAHIGFSGYKYFEKVFRKAFGQSPTSYRKCPESQFLYTT